MNCQARKGFLTLSPCENPGVTACAQCGRTMCPAHLAPGFTTCLACAAMNPQNETDNGQYDDVWASRYRQSYYNDTGYTPVGHSNRFDSYDSDSFDETQRDFAEDERERDGFEGS
jgi:hypothetical protein